MCAQCYVVYRIRRDRKRGLKMLLKRQKPEKAELYRNTRESLIKLCKQKNTFFLLLFSYTTFVSLSMKTDWGELKGFSAPLFLFFLFSSFTRHNDGETRFVSSYMLIKNNTLTEEQAKQCAGTMQHTLLFSLAAVTRSREFSTLFTAISKM